MKYIDRMRFINQAGLLAAVHFLPSVQTKKSAGLLMTVNGAIAADNAGCTLSHEHIMVDFIGADKVHPSRYKREAVFEAALPKLLSVKKAGCKTLIECTPAYLGRDVALLKQLSQASRMNIITNTGYYGAAGEKYYPAHVYMESAEQIAARWIREWEEGIEGTGIRPGFIKTGVDTFPLTPVQQKVIKAAALTHLATGLTIGVHTGDGKAAMEELIIIKEQGVKPEGWIWIHAQNEKNTDYHIKAAREGGWIEFDGVNAASMQHYIELLTVMRDHQLLDQVLISQDSGWYHAGEADGGNFNDYTFIFSGFIPALKKNSFTAAEIDRIFIKNPARAFSIMK